MHHRINFCPLFLYFVSVKYFLLLLQKHNKDFDLIYLGNLNDNHGNKIIDNIYEFDKNEFLELLDDFIKLL